jgi:hypothetical protein
VPIKLREVSKLPSDNADVVEVLGLKIPVGGSLPLGAQAQWTDLLSEYDSGRVGAVEFMLRSFCLYTWRLGKNERINYAWFSQQELHPDDITELFEGVNALQKAMLPDDGEKPKGKTKAAKLSN